jgi:hypothetical protein
MAKIDGVIGEQQGDFPFRILLALAGLISLFVLAYGLTLPLAELHSFRQSQTAISVYWMLHGGNWLDYWTPVLGRPWSAPFEFPLFQWIVVGLVRLTGLAIDPAGRLVSYFWLILGAWPASRLAADLKLPPLAFPIFAVLMLTAPVYLFWGRSFMIETQALTLCLFFLWWGRRALLGDRAIFVLLASTAGLLAILTKVTTSLPFLLALGVIGVIRLARTPGWPERIALALRGLVLVAPGLLLFTLWNHHADTLKSANPLAASLRSDAPRLVAWNFGSLGQRFSEAMVEANLRALQDMFGIAALAVLIGLGWALARAGPDRSTFRAIAACLALYLVPWLVFTNLHIVHDYYQTAIALFGIAAAAIALAAIAEKGGFRLALLLCALIVASQMARFATYQGRAMATLPDRGDLAIAALLRHETRPGQSIIVYGRDWSALIPYYAERTALMEPSWTAASDYRSRLPAGIGGDVGAIVRCPSHLDADPVASRRLDALAAKARVARIGDCAILLPVPSGRAAA